LLLLWFWLVWFWLSKTRIALLLLLLLLWFLLWLSAFDYHYWLILVWTARVQYQTTADDSLPSFMSFYYKNDVTGLPATVSYPS
jgi:hypothetical protein